jgi:hypothetical protein
MFSNSFSADSGDAKDPLDDQDSLDDQQRQRVRLLVVLIDMSSRNNTSSEDLQR